MNNQGLAVHTVLDVPTLVRKHEAALRMLARTGMRVEHETTVANFRRQYHQPEVLTRIAHAQWAAAGRPDAVRNAQHRADELVRQYDYDPPQDALRELAAIYERAKRLLA